MTLRKGMLGKRRVPYPFGLDWDLDNLPPDTFLLYPDLLEESLAEASPGMELSNSPSRETAISAFQKAANQDYLRRFMSPDEIVRVQRSARDPLAAVEGAEKSPAQQQRNSGTQTIRAGENLSLHWSWFRAAICYMTIAFIASLGMFLIPLLRHPKPRLTVNGGRGLSGAGTPDIPRLVSKRISEGRHSPQGPAGGSR